MSNEKHTHLLEEDLTEARVYFVDIMKDLDPIAQMRILERIKGMKDMQDIMTKKSA